MITFLRLNDLIISVHMKPERARFDMQLFFYDGYRCASDTARTGCVLSRSCVGDHLRVDAHLHSAGDPWNVTHQGTCCRK